MYLKEEAGKHGDKQISREEVVKLEEGDKEENKKLVENKKRKMNQMTMEKELEVDVEAEEIHKEQEEPHQ